MRKRFSMPVAATAAAAGGGGGGGGSPADTVDNIEHSVRFNRDDSPYLTRTISGSSNTYTVSMWVKRHKVSATGEYQYLFSFNDNLGLAFNPGDTIYIYNGSGVTPSTAVFRDPSAWYHVCLSVDNLSADVFVNGVEVISNVSMPAMSGKQVINRLAANNPHYGNHSIANIHIIDGYAKAPGDFTFTDSNNVLQPKAYSGSYGTNGAHLDFADTSSATALGNDVSGNNNDFTAGGLVAGPAFTANSFSTEFDGNGDYLHITNSSDLTFGTGDFTIEMWLYATGTTGGLIASDQTGAGYWASLLASGILYWQSQNGQTNLFSTNYTSYLSKWTHVAFVRNNGTTTLYLDGSSATYASDTTNYNGASGNLDIGRDLDNTAYLTGKISNLRVVKGRALYTAAFTPPTTALTATDDTVLLTCQDATVRDNSNLGHSVTPYSDAAAVNQGPFNGYSGNFDGSGDYLTIPHTTDHNPGTGDFTIEGWFKTSATVAYQTIMHKYGSPTVYSGWNIYLSANGTALVVSVLNNTNTQVDLTGGSNLNNGAWHHFALARSGTDLRLFVDGTVVDSTTNSFDIQSTADLRISGIAGNPRDWNGQLSNIRIVKGQALYTANFTPATADFTTTSQSATASNVKLLTCQDSTFADKSGVGEAITANNNAAVSTSSPFANHHSVEFDGSSDYLDIASNAEYAFGTGDFTVEAWVYPTATNVGAIYSNEVANSLFIYFSANNFVVRNYGVANLIATTAPSTNTWTHIAVTRSGTDLRLFFNGVQQGNTVTNSTNFTQNGVEIGAYANGTQSLNGKISNLRVTKGQALYTAAFTPSTTPLTTTSQGAKAGNVKLLTCNSSTIVDTSGKNITATGNASTISVNPHTDKYSVSFPSSGNNIVCSPPNLTGEFNIECWVKGSGSEIFGNWGTGIFLRYSSTTLQFYSNVINLSATGMSRDGWHHLAISRDSSNVVRLFEDGKVVDSGTASGTIVMTNLTIGQENTSGGSIGGHISNFRIVDGQALYTADFLPPTEDLTTTSQGATASNVTLLTCQDYKIQDNSPSPLTLTVNGTAAPSTDAPFVTSGAGSFDGTGDYLSTDIGSGGLGSGDFTIEYWAYSTGIANPPSQRGHFQISATSGGLSTASGSSLALYANDTATEYYDYYPGAASTSALNKEFVWQHFAYVRSSGTIKIYVDGAEVASFSNSTDFSSYRYLAIAGFYNSTYVYKGYISNFRISKGLARYTAAFTPPTEDFDPTDQDTTFLALQGNTLDDLSGNDHAVTAIGNAATTTVSPFEPVDGSDAMLDSPTNYGSGETVRGNYCTLNPVDLLGTGVTLTEGNLKFTTTNSHRRCRGTMFVSSGKWYAEATLNTLGGTYPAFGVMSSDATGSDNYIGAEAGSYGYTSSGQKQNNGSASSYGATYAANDTLGVALDLDAGTVTFYKNGASQGVAYTGLSGSFTPAISGAGSSNTWTLNFGQQPFKYPVAGYKSWCTTNLPTPAVADGSTAMDVALYGGNNSTQSISTPNMSPDLVWLKARNTAYHHRVFDVIRGQSSLRTDTNNAAGNSNNSTLTSFDSTGFSITNTQDEAGNATGTNYVAWTWDAGSSTVTNTEGTVESQVRANPTAGISIVYVTADETTGNGGTVGHGLGKKPEFIIQKNTGATRNWYCQHSGLGDMTGTYIKLDTGDTKGTDNTWNVSEPTSSVMSIDPAYLDGNSHANVIYYVFAPVEGFSAFGSYDANNSTDGPFIYTGFRPRWILLRAHNVQQNWIVIDVERDIDNPDSSYLLPNDTLVEGTLSPGVDILSNGFKLRTNSSGWNGSGQEFIYAAFAEHPFKTSRAR